MSWRTVCVTQRCKLEYRMGYMVIRKEEPVKIHLSEIGVLIVESTAVSLTSSLLSELNKQKIKVIFCDENHNPYGEINPYYGSHDSSRAVRNQVKWNVDTKAKLWQEITRNKITKQAQVLKKSKQFVQAEMLESYVMEVMPGDSTNREGHAAKVYFNALFGMSFSRDDEDVINSCLNYGYTLILACFNREITSAGRITQLGIWHDNIFNFFNLSSDLMEEFRPLVDSYVLDLDLKKGSDFSQDLKHQMLAILEHDVSVEGKTQKLPNAIKIYVAHIFGILDNNEMSPLLEVKYV